MNKEWITKKNCFFKICKIL